MKIRNKNSSDRFYMLVADVVIHPRALAFLLRGGIMSNPLNRAERCRDLAEECRAVAALCTPSTEMRTHYSRMAEHYSSLAEAEELGALAYER
jgi:dihydrodipicolinate synthase/N-acetylneuraminate lyase